jgi:DNA-binding response OmpR family regulator
MTIIKILLVDDQPELLDITRIFLEKGGDIAVDTSTSAVTAIDMLREKKYDAIVSDYEMPQMDGIEFLKTIKRMGLEKPFIIFTGRSREEIVIEALNSGADFYLQKGSEPRVQFAELRNMIHQAVMRKRIEEALIQSETNYKTLVECTQDSIYMVDKRGRYLFMNSHHKNRLGISDRISEIIIMRIFTQMKRQSSSYSLSKQSSRRAGPFIMNIKRVTGGLSEPSVRSEMRFLG